MLTGEQEDRLYLLSETLGVEIYVVGVGGKTFLPAQESRPASAATREGALAEWMMACLEAPEEIPWWTHTHPDMSAFFSTTDVEGAHNLWAAIKRPIMATVLGMDGERHDVVIDEGWIAENPKPKPIGYQAESWGWQDEWERHGITPGGGWAYDHKTKAWRQGTRDDAPRTLAREVIDLVEEFGWGSVHEAVRSCAWLVDSIDELPEELKEDAQKEWDRQMDEAMRGAKEEASGRGVRVDLWDASDRSSDKSAARVVAEVDLFYSPDPDDICPHCNTAALRRSDLPGMCDRCGCLIGATAGR